MIGDEWCGLLEYISMSMVIEVHLATGRALMIISMHGFANCDSR